MKLLSNGNCSARDWQRMLWRRMLANTVIQVVVIDEIGNAKEVAAVKDIAQRGVKMVATVHGTTLQHMLENPVLNPLVGGKQKMVIGDLAARQVSEAKPCLLLVCFLQASLLGQH